MNAPHGADSDAVLWGEAANLDHWNSRQRQVTETHVKRGHFVP